MWPNVGHYVRNIILESVQPGIRESLKGYKLGGFKMDKISLGTMVSLVSVLTTRTLLIVRIDYCSPLESGALKFMISMSRGMKLSWTLMFGKLLIIISQTCVNRT